MKLAPKTVARRGLAALVTERPPLYARPTFPTREVRAAAVRCDDVLADAVTGEALTVVGVGWSSGAAVVLYVRDDKAQTPGATRRLHFTAHEYVLRAVSSVEPAQPQSEDESPDRPYQSDRRADVAERVVGVEANERDGSADSPERSEGGHDARSSAALIGGRHAPHPSPAQPRAAHPGHERTAS